MDRKTPLYAYHERAGGKIVPFAGYLLPIQYPTGVIAEHMAVRTKAGLFDVSHMGEVLLSGPGALDCINHLFTNDFTNMKDGQVRYSPMCNEHGGVVDDLIVYRLGQDSYYVVVNAANRDKDVAWMRSHLIGNTKLEDLSDGIAQLALQGPLAQPILETLVNAALLPAKYYTYTNHVSVSGIDCMISRTGYTGEDGFELYCPAEKGPALWDALLAAGAPSGLIPCGLGARDTLRMEAAMPLYGHEMDDDVTPLETGLDFAVKMKKAEFIGKEGIEARLPLAIKRVGLEVTGRGIVREHCSLFSEGREIGHSTSGTYCPFLGGPIAMALVETAFSELGTEFEAEVRGRRIPVRVVGLPFYKRAK